MAQVTYNEDEQVFETTEEPVNDPIAEGVDDFLQQIEETLPENEVQVDAILEQDPEIQSDETDLPIDAGMVQEGVEITFPDTMEIPQDPFPDYELYNVDSFDDSGIMPLASVPSNQVFTPQTFQINLASGRQLGEHYLMYAQRVYYSSTSSYWHYFLVLGRDIEYENDIYTFNDCDMYSYYSYNSIVSYEFEQASGSVSGGDHLVYSDLYFDYVGTDPVVNSFPYIAFAFFLLIFVAVLIGGRKRV